MACLHSTANILTLCVHSQFLKEKEVLKPLVITIHFTLGYFQLPVCSNWSVQNKRFGCSNGQNTNTMCSDPAKWILNGQSTSFQCLAFIHNVYIRSNLKALNDIGFLAQRGIQVHQVKQQTLGMEPRPYGLGSTTLSTTLDFRAIHTLIQWLYILSKKSAPAQWFWPEWWRYILWQRDHFLSEHSTSWVTSTCLFLL